MTFLVLTFLGLVLGRALWALWPACITTTCISSMHIVYGYGAALDGHELAGAVPSMTGTTFLVCMWWVEHQHRQARKEPLRPWCRLRGQLPVRDPRGGGHVLR